MYLVILFQNSGTAFQYEEVESSTDSEDEVLQRFQQSSSLYSGLRKVGGGENIDQNGGNMAENYDNHRNPFSSLAACNGSSGQCNICML